MLVNSFPDDHNRSRGIFNYRFVKQLKELKQQVFVVFFRMWAPNRKVISNYFYDGIKVTQVCLPLFPFNHYYFLKANIFICRVFGWILLKKQLKDSNIIHSVYLTNNGIIAGHWARKLKLPHVAQAIGSDVNSDLKTFLQKKYLKWILNIDGIITNSYDLEKTIKGAIDNCPSTETIYRGIIIKDFEMKGNLQVEGISFLYLGGLEFNKRLEFGINTKGGITLMDAWKKVESELCLKKAKLFFGGPSSDNAIFKRWLLTLKCPQNVQLLGKIDPREVDIFLTKCNIVIIPSMEEGLPNFLMESAANKRAGIGSTAGGIPEFIEHGITGFIFEKGNVEQLSDFLIKVASEKERTVCMGESAYNRVKVHFNAVNYSTHVIDFYQKINNKCVG